MPLVAPTKRPHDIYIDTVDIKKGLKESNKDSTLLR